MTIRTNQYDPNVLFNEQQRPQIERLRNEILQTQSQNNQLKNKNRDMQDVILGLRQRIRDLKEDGI